MREIHLKEHVLLAHSAVIEKEEYCWLKELLNSYNEITTEIVEGLDSSKKDLFENVLPLIKRQAFNEWEVAAKDMVIEDLGEERQNCSICHTNIKYVCYIKNKFNNNELQIGSTCVKYFGFNGNKSIKELIKDAKRLRKITEIEKILPGIDNMINTWKETIDDFEVIIPADLEKPYLNLYDKTKSIYDNYLDGKVDTKCFKEIKNLIMQKDNLFKKMAQYNKKYKNYISIPKVSAKKWLVNRNMHNVITKLKNDKIYTVRTLHRVKEPRFMDEIASLMNEKLFVKVEGKITKVVHERYSYNYLFQCNPQIILDIKHEDLLLEYGYLLFNKKPVKEFNMYNLLSMSKITNRSYDTVINMLIKLFRETEYSIHYYDINFNDIFIKAEEEYYNLSLDQLIQNTRYALFSLDKTDVINDYLSKTKSKAMNKEDVDELINRRR